MSSSTSFKTRTPKSGTSNIGTPRKDTSRTGTPRTGTPSTSLMETQGNNDNSQLFLVHVLFRHGERTTDKMPIYPKDPHKDVSYEPYGYGQLTNDGKRTMYQLGQILRNRYDAFLGPVYYPGIADPWSSDFDRTKSSLQLVLASLFKPTIEQEIWNEKFLWQPIPQNYIPFGSDDLFLPLLNRRFRRAYFENHQTSKFAQNLLEKYRPTFELLREYTGATIETVHDVFRIHDVLTTEEEFGLEIPDWAKPMHKGVIREIATFDAELQMETRELKQMAMGKMVGKIVADTQRKIGRDSKHKIHLYGGHDINVSNMLIALGVRYPHLPNYGACIIMEIYKLTSGFVLKVFYRPNKTQDFKQLPFKEGDVMQFANLRKIALDLNS